MAEFKGNHLIKFITSQTFVNYSVTYSILVVHVNVFTCSWTSEFLISSYGTPLAQRASYYPLHSSLFGPDDTVNYDCITLNY